jgi:hypothetical protein
MARTWTAAQVREELPIVSVLMADGKVYPGQVSGRLEKFAKVTVRYHQAQITAEFAWDTLAHALRENRPVCY